MIISIVTPVLNGIDYFKECIESVRAAARSPAVEAEHIVVDGGSTDGSFELAESYGLQTIKRADLGLTERMNLGYRSARGELIGFLGADDLLLPGAIETIDAAYRRGSKRWVVGDIIEIAPNGGSLGRLRPPPHWIPAKAIACMGWNPISPLAAYVNRDFFDELGGFDPEYKMAADFDFSVRALQREPFERIAQPIAYYRRHLKNLSVIAKSPAVAEARSVQEKFGAELRVACALIRYAAKAHASFSNPELFFRRAMQRGLTAYKRLFNAAGDPPGHGHS